MRYNDLVDLYHVTFTKYVPGILDKGLLQLQSSNWVKGPEMIRYNGDAGLFAFEHPEDAINWANKMQYDFQNPDVSIIKFKSNDSWHRDPSEDPSLTFGKGKSMRSLQNVDSKNIITTFNIKDFGTPLSTDMSRDEWLAMVSGKIS